MSEGFDADELRVLYRCFVDEATGHLAAIDEALAALAADPSAASQLGILRRRLHTLKGAAGSIGLEEMAEAARALEQRFATTPAPVASAALAELGRAVEQLRAILAGVLAGAQPPRA